MNKFSDGIFRTNTSVTSSGEISEMSDGNWGWSRSEKMPPNYN